MHWIYLSPHLDDVALSCGGLVWEQAQLGETVSIWTICAGDPPPGPLSPFAQKLHDRWKTGPNAVAERRQEDITSCKILLATYHHFDVPDCIYRRIEPCHDTHSTIGKNTPKQTVFPYKSEEALFGQISPAEEPLIEHLRRQLFDDLPKKTNLVAPLGIGNHVDHQLTRIVAELTGRRLWYYQDYPYILGNLNKTQELEQTGWEKNTHSITPQGLQAWIKAIAAHQSQISTFWIEPEGMHQSIEYYLGLFGGINLWQKP